MSAPESAALPPDESAALALPAALDGLRAFVQNPDDLTDDQAAGYLAQAEAAYDLADGHETSAVLAKGRILTVISRGGLSGCCRIG